jgi:prolipoprotein diacylglyceryltransferase
LLLLIFWWAVLSSRPAWNIRVALAIISVVMLAVYALTYVAVQAGQVMWMPDHVPIYGFGLMLFVAFILCVWLGKIRSSVEGIPPETIEDLAIWIFLGGLLGARLTSLFTTGQYPSFTSWQAMKDWLYKLIAIWDGGIVLYGAIVGGTISFFVAYFLYYRKADMPSDDQRPADMSYPEWYLLKHRKKGLNILRFIDVVIPSVALGLVLGRLGCFFNGCCYGQVACAACVAVTPMGFPMCAPPREVTVSSGYQTVAGFTLKEDPLGRAIVGKVVPGSPAEKAGLREGDQILEVGPQAHVKRKIASLLVLLSQMEGEVRRAGPNTQKPLSEQQKQMATKALEADQPNAASALRKAAEATEDGNLDEARKELKKASEALEEAQPNAEEMGGSLTIRKASDLDRVLGGLNGWDRGETQVVLKVRSSDGKTEVLRFTPYTIGLYPTQLYESLSMLLLLLVLLAYTPLRHNPGQVAALFMMCYGVHRYLNELLRDDPRPKGLESYGSVIMVVAGLALWGWLQSRPSEDAPEPYVPPPEELPKAEAALQGAAGDGRVQPTGQANVQQKQ